LPDSLRAFSRIYLLQANNQAVSVQCSRQGKDDVVRYQIAQDGRMADMFDTLPDGEHAAYREQGNRDHERPEIEFLSMAEWMEFVRRPLAAFGPEKKEQAIADVDTRMEAFGQHGRTAGNQCGHELPNRDQCVRSERSVDDLFRASRHATFDAGNSGFASLLFCQSHLH